MRVSERGVVAFDTAQLEPGEYQAYVHDPSYQESARKAAAEWAAQLAVAVQVVNDADDGCKLTLAALMQDSNLPDGTINGFNREPLPSPYPSLEQGAKAQHMYEWRSPDPGSGAFNTEEPTAENLWFLAPHRGRRRLRESRRRQRTTS
jgi:hypothetical protein